MTEVIPSNIRAEFDLQAEIEATRTELEYSQRVLERVQNQDGSVAIAGLFELANTMARVDQAERRLAFLQGGPGNATADHQSD